jgi:streptogramin lyase
LDFDTKGDLWLVLRNANQIFRLDLKLGSIHHVAGTGEKGFTGNGGDARLATLSGPKGIAISSDGKVYIADTESHSIRMIDSKTGLLSLVVGTGSAFDGADGDPLLCGLARPHGIFVEEDGSLLIGDSENHKIRVLKLSH